jgi:hypothetical protein
VKRETENRGVVGLGLDGLGCSGELGVGIEECSGRSWLWVENLRICGFEVWFLMGEKVLGPSVRGVCACAVLGLASIT